MFGTRFDTRLMARWVLSWLFSCTALLGASSEGYGWVDGRLIGSGLDGSDESSPKVQT